MVAARYDTGWTEKQFEDAVLMSKMLQRLLPPISSRGMLDDEDESPTYTGNRLWRHLPCDGSEFGSGSRGGFDHS